MKKTKNFAFFGIPKEGNKNYSDIQFYDVEQSKLNLYQDDCNKINKIIKQI
jgi:hypothetical protein